MENNEQFKYTDPAELTLLRTFDREWVKVREDFYTYYKPRMDRSYKLYRSYTGDRQKKIKTWQSNVFIPYLFSVVETLLPRIIGAKPDFSVIPREKGDIKRANVAQQLIDYIWEEAQVDYKTIPLAKSALIYGLGIGKTRWSKIEQQSYILDQVLTDNGQTSETDAAERKYKPETKILYDNPQFDDVDVYDFFPSRDGSDINGPKSIRFGYQRNLLTLPQLKETYPGAKNLKFVKPGLSANSAQFGSGDARDFKLVRKEVMYNRDKIYETPEGVSYIEGELARELIEVIERWEPTRYIVRANGVPIINIPNPYSHGQLPYIKVDFVPLPDEFYPLGMADMIGSMNLMLNTIKNQRIDNVTMSIHKMWIVDPMSNINNKDLITKPFGIIYSNNPHGVKPVEFSDIKQSSYLEEDRLKEDMRNATGVDDYSRGASAMANSATEASYLRESTLERVKLFLRSLEKGYSDIMRQWFSMIKDFYPEEKILRIVNDDGSIEFPLVKKDDFMGVYDFKSSINSTTYASQELKKKQDMDLVQVLSKFGDVVKMPQVLEKLIADFGWDPDTLITKQKTNPMEPPSFPAGAGGMPPGMPPELAAMLAGGGAQGGAPKSGGTGQVNTTVSSAPQTKTMLANALNQSQNLQ